MVLNRNPQGYFPAQTPICCAPRSTFAESIAVRSIDRHQATTQGDLIADLIVAGMRTLPEGDLDHLEGCIIGYV